MNVTIRAFQVVISQLRSSSSTRNTPEPRNEPASPPPNRSEATLRGSSTQPSSAKDSQATFRRYRTSFTLTTTAEEITRNGNAAAIMAENAIFTQAQADQMVAIIANVMRMAGINQQSPLPEDRRAPHHPAFRARDVGYFDFNPDVPVIEVKENHNVYHNVFSFTNRLRVKADIMNTTMLRQNLDAYLLGTAEQ